MGPLIDRGATYFNIDRTESFIDFHASLSDRQKLVDIAESTAAKRESNADMNILQTFAWHILSFTYISEYLDNLCVTLKESLFKFSSNGVA